jgi:hypothetical protein
MSGYARGARNGWRNSAACPSRAARVLLREGKRFRTLTMPVYCPFRGMGFARESFQKKGGETVGSSRRKGERGDPRRDLLVSLLNVVRESLAELATLNSEIEKLAQSAGKEEDLDQVLLKLYAMLIQVQNARAALESGHPRPGNTASADGSPACGPMPDIADCPGMSYREYVELLSMEEYQRFHAMGPIADAEFSEHDIEDLLGRLTDE